MLANKKIVSPNKGKDLIKSSSSDELNSIMANIILDLRQLANYPQVSDEIIEDMARTWAGFWDDWSRRKCVTVDYLSRLLKRSVYQAETQRKQNGWGAIGCSELLVIVERELDTDISEHKQKIAQRLAQLGDCAKCSNTGFVLMSVGQSRGVTRCDCGR